MIIEDLEIWTVDFDIIYLCPHTQHEIRQTHSIVKEIKNKILEVRSAALPSSILAKACNYALGQWGQLTCFLDHGILEIDNNLCENSIRPLALGRKNCLPIGSSNAGTKISSILSILETCRRLQINARHYLFDVLPLLAQGSLKSSALSQISPMAWKQNSQPSSSKV